MKDGTKNGTRSQTPMQVGQQMEGNPPQGGKRIDTEKLRQVRLRNLLRELVDEEGRVEAADMLGVNYRTLARAMESGQITGRMSDALHRLLGPRQGPEVARLTGRLATLEFRVKKLETTMREAAKAGSKADAPPSVPRLRAPERTVPRRTDPELVTVEPAPDDAEVYGDAWPLVAEWRELRADHPHQGTTLSWLADHLRLLTLELAMMEQHELTLPPEREPLRGFARRGQTAWRREAVRDTQNALAKRIMLRWVRRILTLGLWRK